MIAFSTRQRKILVKVFLVSDSNSSTESGSSVGSDTTVSSNGDGGGSDGNSNNFHLPATRKNLEPGRISGMSGKMFMAQEFGLSPPSESNLMRRRHKEDFDQNLPLTGRKGNHSSLHALVTDMANEY
jgi:hypothetical protein